jgi:Flavin containing amine oxidoreductase
VDVMDGDRCPPGPSVGGGRRAQAICTRWGQDSMALGAYSSIAVGCVGGEDYDIMAESIGGRLFFAGEATTRKYPATMHGAFFTGCREVRGAPAAVGPLSPLTSQPCSGKGQGRPLTHAALQEWQGR